MSKPERPAAAAAAAAAGGAAGSAAEKIQSEIASVVQFECKDCDPIDGKIYMKVFAERTFSGVSYAWKCPRCGVITFCSNRAKRLQKFADLGQWECPK